MTISIADTFDDYIVRLWFERDWQTENYGGVQETER